VDVVPVPQLSDNYAYLLIDPASHRAGVVDCAEAEPVLAEAARRGAKLVAVLATHPASRASRIGFATATRSRSTVSAAGS